MDGVLVIDKPEGWTSHDAVSRTRRIAQTKRVGHLGTLDPIATGVLPLVIGRATRLARFYTRSDKVYEAVVRFGYATDTYDRAGTPIGPEKHYFPAEDELERAMAAFRGEFLQEPPPVSAKKVGGVRAYHLARQNVAVELQPVPVRVYELVLLGIEGPDARVRAHCSGGTYMRSIAHDLGRALGCGAHLRELRRTASAEFTVEQAHTPQQLEQMALEGSLQQALIPASRMLPEFPAAWVDDLLMTQIRQGRNFPVSPFRVPQGTRYVKALSRNGDLVAIGEIALPNSYHPVVVL